MATIAITKKINTIDSFQVGGEKFVVLKKEYLDELLLLMRSFVMGERLLKEEKTRNFNDFLKTTTTRRK